MSTTLRTISSRQTTLAGRAHATGAGLHTGKTTKIIIGPAAAGEGIFFETRIRTRLKRVRARPEAVVDSRFSTVLEENGSRVYTVEHLLAALYGMGVDNARIELYGEEIPALDGSALGFARLIIKAGTRTLAAPRRRLALKKTVRIGDDQSRLVISPARRLIVDCHIDYPHPLVGRQRRVFVLRRDWFLRQIAPARTFGFIKDLDKLRRLGRARGATLENTLALSENGLLNPEGLRFPDEFARHKILDILGDFSLLGVRLQCRIAALRSGHRLHHEGVREIFLSHSALAPCPG